MKTSACWCTALQNLTSEYLSPACRAIGFLQYASGQTEKEFFALFLAADSSNCHHFPFSGFGCSGRGVEIGRVLHFFPGKSIPFRHQIFQYLLRLISFANLLHHCLKINPLSFCGKWARKFLQSQKNHPRIHLASPVVRCWKTGSDFNELQTVNVEISSSLARSC